MGEKGNQRRNSKLKLKLKTQRPAFKVVRDMLTRKWVIVKEDMQLCDWTLRRFLDTCNKLLSTNDIADMKNLMEGIWKLTHTQPHKIKKVKKVLQSAFA